MNGRFILNKRNAHTFWESYMNWKKKDVTEDFQIFFGVEFSVNTDEIPRTACGKPCKYSNRFPSASVFYLDVVFVETGPVTPVNKNPATLIRSNRNLLLDTNYMLQLNLL